MVSSNFLFKKLLLTSKNPIIQSIYSMSELNETKKNETVRKLINLILDKKILFINTVVI